MIIPKYCSSPYPAISVKWGHMSPQQPPTREWRRMDVRSAANLAVWRGAVLAWSRQQEKVNMIVKVHEVKNNFWIWDFNIWLHKYSVWVFPMIFVTKTALSLASSRYEKYRILGFQNCAYLKCMFFTGVKVKIVTFLQDYSLVKSKHGWSQSVRRTPNAALCQPCTERSCKGESG